MSFTQCHFKNDEITRLQCHNLMRHMRCQCSEMNKGDLIKINDACSLTPTPMKILHGELIERFQYCCDIWQELSIKLDMYKESTQFRDICRRWHFHYCVDLWIRLSSNYVFKCLLQSHAFHWSERFDTTCSGFRKVSKSHVFLFIGNQTLVATSHSLSWLEHNYVLRSFVMKCLLVWLRLKNGVSSTVLILSFLIKFFTFRASLDFLAMSFV